MNKYVWIVVGAMGIFILGVTISFVFSNNSPHTIGTTPPPTLSQPPVNVSSSPDVVVDTSLVPSGPQQNIFYPILNYDKRITNRWYGKKVTPEDSNTLPCGAGFSGYHTGDDLEVTQDELQKNIPVYAMAKGTVRQAGTVNGYGGLIVIQHIINDQQVTAYYGHVNIQKADVKAGDTVQAGQQLTVLGDACSAQTDNERKHLHFALHKGTSIDIKGYVDTESALNAWIAPRAALDSAGAKNHL